MQKPCLKRCSSGGDAAEAKRRSVTINQDANVVKLVAYYGRPQQSPDVARACFYTETDCAHTAASNPGHAA